MKPLNCPIKSAASIALIFYRPICRHHCITKWVCFYTSFVLTFWKILRKEMLQHGIDFFFVFCLAFCWSSWFSFRQNGHLHWFQVHGFIYYRHIKCQFLTQAQQTKKALILSLVYVIDKSPAVHLPPSNRVRRTFILIRQAYCIVSPTSAVYSLHPTIQATMWCVQQLWGPGHCH